MRAFRDIPALDEEPAITPEEMVARLRDLAGLMGTLVHLTPAQKKKLRNGLTRSDDVRIAQINLVGSDALIESAVAPIGLLRDSEDAWGRWTSVASQLRGMLDGVEGAILVRRYEHSARASRGARIARVLASDPQYDHLIPFVERVRHLNKVARRRKGGVAEVQPEEPQQAA